MTTATPDAADVIAIVGGGFTETQVEALIADAVLIAEECVSSYSDDKQKAIIKWLTAHLIVSTTKSGVVTSERLGDASVSYARASMGDALKGTTYGQQVLLLDTNGCLAKKGRAKSTIEVV